VWERGELYTGFRCKNLSERPLAIHRKRWGDNIKMAFGAVGWGHGMD